MVIVLEQYNSLTRGPQRQLLMLFRVHNVHGLLRVHLGVLEEPKGELLFQHPSHGPIDQRDLFLRLGIEQRAAALKASATGEQAADIEAALSRLLARGARGMGELFKAIAIAAPQLGALPGFES